MFMVTLPIDALLIIENQKSQGPYGFHSFPVVDFPFGRLFGAALVSALGSDMTVSG
jgi:hypothetical protein